MRKFVRIFNNNKTIDYDKKLSFSFIKKIKSLVNSFKINDDLQNLIIFYLLYSSGITFCFVLRCKLSDFIKNLITKGKTKIITIPFIIQKIFIAFFRTKENSFFYDSF